MTTVTGLHICTERYHLFRQEGSSTVPWLPGFEMSQTYLCRKYAHHVSLVFVYFHPFERLVTNNAPPTHRFDALVLTFALAVDAAMAICSTDQPFDGDKKRPEQVVQRHVEAFFRQRKGARQERTVLEGVISSACREGGVSPQYYYECIGIDQISLHGNGRCVLSPCVQRKVNTVALSRLACAAVEGTDCTVVLTICCGCLAGNCSIPQAVADISFLSFCVDMCDVEIVTESSLTSRPVPFRFGGKVPTVLSYTLQRLKRALLLSPCFSMCWALFLFLHPPRGST